MATTTTPASKPLQPAASFPLVGSSQSKNSKAVQNPSSGLFSSPAKQESSQRFPTAKEKAMVGGSTSAGGDTSANRGHKSVTRASCSILFTTAVFVASASRRGTLLAASRRPPDAESAMPGQWLLGAGAGGRRDTAAPPTLSPTRQQAGWHRPRLPHAPDGVGPLLHLTGDTTARQQAVSSSASIQHPTTPPFGVAGEAVPLLWCGRRGGTARGPISSARRTTPRRDGPLRLHLGATSGPVGGRRSNATARNDDRCFLLFRTAPRPGAPGRD
jgi:hypothetical protein